MEPKNRFHQAMQPCGRCDKQGCRTVPPGWESITGLLKRFTNMGSEFQQVCILQIYSIVVLSREKVEWKHYKCSTRYPCSGIISLSPHLFYFSLWKLEILWSCSAKVLILRMQWITGIAVSPGRTLHSVPSTHCTVQHIDAPLNPS